MPTSSLHQPVTTLLCYANGKPFRIHLKDTCYSPLTIWFSQSATKFLIDLDFMPLVALSLSAPNLWFISLKFHFQHLALLFPYRLLKLIYLVMEPLQSWPCSSSIVFCFLLSERLSRPKPHSLNELASHEVKQPLSPNRVISQKNSMKWGIDCPFSILILLIIVWESMSAPPFQEFSCVHLATSSRTWTFELESVRFTHLQL